MKEKPLENTTSPKRKGRVLRFFVKFLIVIAALTGVFFAASMPKKDRTVAAEEAAPTNVDVMTITAEPKFAETFELPAVVEPNRVVTISAEVSGSIESIPVVKGNPIHKGELLIELNSDLIKPQVAVSEAQLNRDKIQYERMKNLVANEATSKSDLDDATTRLAVSQATLENITAQFKRSRIFSPVSGTLNRLLVDEGEYVQPGMQVAEIVETDPAKIVVDIPEKDVSYIKETTDANISFDYQGKPQNITGTITFLSKLADQQTRSVPMEITVENHKGYLHSGQIVKVLLTRRTIENAILIPLSAVIPLEKGYAVFIVDSAIAQRKEVELGIIKSDRVQISNGLKPGDLLIVAGHRFVAPGQKVNVVSKDVSKKD
jgi:membrane fusion protein, multidrug efflux system